MRATAMAIVEDWAEIDEAWDVEGFAPEPTPHGLRLESAGRGYGRAARGGAGGRVVAVRGKTSDDRFDRSASERENGFWVVFYLRALDYSPDKLACVRVCL